MGHLSETIELVKALMEDKNYNQAIQALKNLKEQPERDIIDYYLGMCYCKIGDLDKGISYFRSSANFDESEYAFRSFNNLAALYKRKEGTENHLIAFGYLEDALELIENLNQTDKKKKTYEKLARYLIELDLFDKFDDKRLGVDWKVFRKNLPLDALPKDKTTRAGLISLILADIYWCRENNFAETGTYLAECVKIFKSDLPMLSHIAQFQYEIIGHTAVIAEKVYLQEKTKQAQEDLARLYDVGKAMTSVLDLDRLLALIVDNVIEIAHAERGFLMLGNHGDLVEFRIARDCRGNTLSEEQFTISRTIYKKVVGSGEAILLADIENDEEFRENSSIVELHLKSALCVPLKIDGNILGVIYVDNSIARGNFGQRELDLLTTLSSQAAIAIENASLYRSLEEKKRYLENMLAGTKQMSQAEEKLAAIAICAGHILKAIPPFKHTQPYLYLMEDEHIIFSYRWEDGNFVNYQEDDIPEFGEISDITLSDGKIRIPIVCDKKQVGILSFVNLPKRNIRIEDKYFIDGLMNSLSLTLSKIEREKQKQTTLVGQMASGIIHDLKNPIAVIRGYADLMSLDRRSVNIGEHKKYLKFIVQQADDMVRMVNDILDFAKGELKLHIAPYPVTTYMETVATYVSHILYEANINLDLQFDYSGNVFIDPERFQRVILNIMKNAIEAIDENGKIIVTISEKADSILFTIANDGAPIPEEVQKNLFEPFITHGKRGGTGLGMAIAKRIVEEHGGDITFESNPGEMTKFFINIPKKPQNKK